MARFEQKTWIDGDLINAFEFNRIEQGVADSNGDSSGAVETANTAASDAAEAKRLATIAEQNSANAVSTANAASKVATDADNSIHDALAQVNTATTAATEAKNAADRAAEQAATTASNAAQQAIETANGAAAQAIETANNAAATANAAAERAENAASALTDTTLTVSGRAADSKAVGDRLDEKADSKHTHAVGDVVGLQAKLEEEIEPKFNEISEEFKSKADAYGVSQDTGPIAAVGHLYYKGSTKSTLRVIIPISVSEDVSNITLGNGTLIVAGTSLVTVSGQESEVINAEKWPGISAITISKNQIFITFNDRGYFNKGTAQYYTLSGLVFVTFENIRLS